MSIRTSDQIGEISKALAKAQGKFSAAVKSSQNPAFRSKYADLSSVIDATLEHLNSEGITCMQHPALEYKQISEGNVEAYITVTTRLLHSSGEWIESDLSIPAVQRDRFDAQSCGSALTYACRYALQSICVVPREDDDGNAATGRGTHEAAQAVAQKKIAQSGKIPTATKVDTLFYVIPKGQEQEGIEWAEFVNIPSYIASNLDRENELRFAFSAVKAKKGANDAVKVNTEKLQDLLSTLAGELGMKVQQLQASKEQ